MAVVRISPRVNMGQILASQINIDNPTDSHAIISGNDPVNGARLRYNESTTKWQYSNDGLIYNDIGSGTGGSGAVPAYKIIEGVAITGDVHLVDGVNWAVNKSLIKTIHVTTSSTDWDLYILQNDNTYAVNDANIPAMQLMASGNGNETIQRDFPYEDEDATTEVHLYFVDNAASNTADITIVGYDLT